MIQAPKFFRRTPRDRALFVEALFALSWAKICVHLLAFRRLAPRLGAAQTETPTIIAPTERAMAVDVSWAVQAAARHVPLRFVCLPQAIAAKQMLRRRGIATTLYLGVSPDREKPEAIAAHAWLRAGDKIVTGEEEMARHRAIAWFAEPPGGAKGELGEIPKSNP